MGRKEIAEALRKFRKRAETKDTQVDGCEVDVDTGTRIATEFHGRGLRGEKENFKVEVVVVNGNIDTLTITEERHYSNQSVVFTGTETMNAFVDAIDRCESKIGPAILKTLT